MVQQKATNRGIKRGTRSGPHGSTRKRTKARVTAPTLLTLFPEYRKKQYRTRVAAQRDTFIEELREAYMHRGLVLYIGAGISRSVGLPSWPGLIHSLTVTMMSRRVESAINALGGMKEDKYWETITAIQEDVAREADYDRPILMMARAIKDELQDELPSIVARNLYRHVRYLRRLGWRHKSWLMRQLPSSRLMDSIVALARAERDIKGVQAIVNYNYDDLLDEKLREQNVRCVTVRSGRDRVPTGALACYHVHGVLPVKNLAKKKPFRPGDIGNLVFSEDEYHAEYSDPYRWSNMTQMSFLGRHVGLFVGLSLEDPNIRRLIDVTHRQYPDVPNYAILPRKRSLRRSNDSKATVLRSLFEEVETTSFEKIGVRVIWADAYDEVPEIILQICAEA